ncbi:glycosyltransferase family 2 protein [Chryseobacterium sp. BLS98]|uniref:glycosyltransferase family 2 protein n=1 Tax=Chryseobacterium sp. BLS98 TaxID=885586 RepID=UPI00065AFBA2|nr:glycosyltransferase family 2 protein [Chryseobacterium sp. BLS98]
MSQNPLVSVIIITYNQENYIGQAINGVLMQNFSENIEVIIADDNSPDNTEEVIKSFSDHPNFGCIKYFKHRENMGMMPNFIWAYNQCKGKYIALCEGDDYWIDSLKLQKQVDFLERNPEYSLTFHKIKELTTQEEKFTFTNPDEEKTYTISDLSKENFIITVSVVFKKNIATMPDWLQYSPIGDYPLHLLNASYGLIKYFPDEMAVYRVGSGTWSTQNTVDQIINTMFSLRFLLQHFKNDKDIFDHLKIQYTNFQKTLLRPFEERKSLEMKVKDYNYLESITSFSSLLKMAKIKIVKKLKNRNSN